MPDLVLPLPGAHCGACRAEILRALAAVPGADDAVVDLRTRTLQVRDDVDEALLRDVLAGAGYPVGELPNPAPSRPQPVRGTVPPPAGPGPVRASQPAGADDLDLPVPDAGHGPTHPSKDLP